jgi:LPS sulfotransferase NodH
MLTGMMLGHPNIYGSSELLGKLNGRNPRDILDNLFQPQKTSVKAVGFKMHYNHPSDGDKEATLEMLVNYENLHIIHLSRKNILRARVSEKIAQKIKMFELHSSQNRPNLEERQVTVTAKELKNLIDISDKRYQSYNTLFSSHPIIEVEYEQLVNEPKFQYQRITQFLDLPDSEPIIKSIVMNPEPLSDLVKNFSELKEEFYATEWGWMFE